MILPKIRVLHSHGRQAIPDLDAVELTPEFRGRPCLTETRDADDAEHAAAVCPTGAFTAAPLALDLGRCLFCGECARIAPRNVRFTNDYRIGSPTREGLVVRPGDPRIAFDAGKVRPEIRRSYATETAFDRAAVKVMSYNVRSFYGEDGRSSVDDILRLIEEQAPDLICLQEFNARLAEQSEEFSLLGEKYEIAHFGRTQAPDSVYGSTLTILSKYRILRSDTVLTPSSSVWADVIVGEDTVRVFNNHLRSTAINASDNQFITSHQFLSDTARETKIRSIVTRLRENSVLRAAQVDSIAQVVGATRTRRIVCGDFNDTPMSYVYRTMARGLRDAFRECGSGYSHTFRGFYNTLRIDYVLSGGFEPLSYEVLPVDYSDHHPVVVRLRKSS